METDFADLPSDPAALSAIIGELYRIERSMRGQPAAGRLKVRKAQIVPNATALRAYPERERARPLAESPTAGAIRCALSRWMASCRHLDDGGVEINGNAAEQAIRRVTPGGKNRPFAGLDEGGVRAAWIMTLIETARRSGVDPKAWLRDALARMHDRPARRIDELLPWDAKSDVFPSAAPAQA